MKIILMSNDPVQLKILIVLGIIYLGLLCLIPTIETAIIICVFYSLAIVLSIFVSSIEYHYNNARII